MDVRTAIIATDEVNLQNITVPLSGRSARRIDGTAG
jgi:hypothetical protein